MPWGDWQFWLVTLAAIAAAWTLWRALVPRKRGKRTELTVGGASPRRTRR